MTRFIFAALMPMCLAATVHAQEDDRARSHFDAGSSYYSEGDYESALREFERAYALSPRPDFYFNYALVYERMGDLDNAVLYLRRYLEETPAERVADRPTLEQRLANFEARLRQQQDRQRSEAERRQAEEARLRELEAQQRSDSGEGIPVPLLVSFGAGAVGLVGFGVFGALTLGADADLEEGCITRRTCDQADVDTARTFALLTDLSLLVGLAGIGVGVTLLWLDDDDEESQASAAIVPVLAPGSVGTVLRGAF